MAIYRNFYTQFWDDDFILDLSKDERYLYFYLITNPKTTLSGIYELPYKVIEFHTSLNKVQIDRLLESLEKKEKIIYDKTTNEVCIRNWLKYNITKSPKLVVSLEKSFKDVKNQNLIQFLNGLDTVSILYRYPIDTVCIPSVSECIKDSFNSFIEKDTKDFKDTNRFNKPSVEEVKNYCKERNNGIDGEAFWNFYESKGWKIGQTPMKSWKAAVVTWEKKNNANKPRDPKQAIGEEIGQVF